MTVYSFDKLHLWSQKMINRMDTTFTEALSAMIEKTPVVPGIRQGGARIRGTIPYDTRKLEQSLRVEINGTTSISGPISTRFGVKAGDFARFVWTAEYASYVHNGANGVPGTFWVDSMKRRWPGHVSGAVRRAKARHP